MAEGKSTFVLYSDQKEMFEALSDEKAGKLIKHIFRYVNDEEPVADDEIVKLMFIPIQRALKRDLKKWENKKTQFSEAGKVSAKSRRLQRGVQLYVLKVWNDSEGFVIVGVTDHSISRRFSSKNTFKGTNYKFEIVDQVFTKDPVKLEAQLLEKFKEFSYSPEQEFSSHMEFFQLSVLQRIKSFLTSFKNVQRRSTNSTVNVNDNVNVNVNVSSKDDVIKKEPDNDTLYPIAKLEEFYIADQIIVTTILREWNISSKEKLIELMDDFRKNLVQKGQHAKTFKDYCSHFRYWFNKTKTAQSNYETSRPDYF